MYKRIAELRKNLNMNQNEFADSIGIGQSTLAMIETNKRQILDRHIIAICSKYNVDEHWLRTGEGSMYLSNDDKFSSFLSNISTGDDDFIRAFIEIYMELDDVSKEVLRNFAKKMSKKV